MLDFSRHYAMRARQNPRTGPVLGSLPSLGEIEEMINMQRRTENTLICIRAAVISREHTLAEQITQRLAFKSRVQEDNHMALYQQEHKDCHGFAGAETKKRRGVCQALSIHCIVGWLIQLQKAALPRHCHSCNRPETPEWRRGPDGPRTLCNACGLHYAKLMRNLGRTRRHRWAGA